MQKEKRRPTLDELKLFPVELWRLEVAQISVDAEEAGQVDVQLEADALIKDPEISPEKVVALRERLHGATGDTAAEVAPCSAA